MSLQSWQQTVGLIGFLISISLYAQIVTVQSIETMGIFFMIFISGAFFGYGLIVRHKQNCNCLECGTKKIIKRNKK